MNIIIYFQSFSSSVKFLLAANKDDTKKKTYEYVFVLMPDSAMVKLLYHPEPGYDVTLDRLTTSAIGQGRDPIDMWLSVEVTTGKSTKLR